MRDEERSKPDLIAELEALRSLVAGQPTASRFDADAMIEEARSDRNAFNRTARRVFDSCRELTGARSGYVALLNEMGDENEVLFLESGGLPCSVDPELAMPVRGLRAEAYRTGEVAFENDFAASEWVKWMPPGHARLDNVLFAPLNVRGQARGLIGLANKPGGFTERDATVALALGDICAAELENYRMRREREAQERRLWFQARLLDAVEQAIVVTDPEGCVTYWNPFAERLYGWTAVEATGKTTLQLIAAKQSAEQGAEIMAQLQRGESWSGEYTARTRDGSEVLVHITCSPIRDAGGRLTHIIGVSHDITERKRAELELATREADLRDAQQIARLGRWELDLVGNELHWSPMVFEIFDIDPDRFGASYEAFLDTVHPDDREAVDHAYRTSVEERRPYNIRHRLLMKDGRVKWVNEICRNTYDAEGRALRSVGTVQDITAQVELRQRLDQSREWMETIFHASRDIALLLDKDGTILVCNPVLAQSLGVAFEEMAGRDYRRLVRGATPTARAAKVREVFASGRELRFVDERDGRHFDNHFIPLPDPDGRVGRVAIFARDITEQQRQLEQLREQEERLKEAQQLAKVGSWVWEVQSNTVSWSDETFRIMGFEPGEVEPSAELFDELLHPDDREEYIRAREASMAAGDTGPVEHRLVTRAGEVRHLQQRGQYILDEAGEIDRIIGTMQDVTERKLAEEQLLEADSRWRSISESVVEHIMLLTRQGEIRFINRTHPDLDKDQVVGKTVFDFTPEAFHATTRRCLEKTWTTGERTSYRTEFVDNAGQKVLFEVRIAPVLKQGRVDALISSSRDITDQLRIERELQKTEKLDSIGVLAGGIAHDFNNIVAGLLTNIQLARLSLDPSPEAIDLLQDAEEACRRAASLTKQLLTFSRGGQPVTQPAQLADHLEDWVRFALRGSNVGFELQIDDDLAVVEVDLGQLGQVINNLVINADQAMPAGGLIRVRAESLELPPGAEVAALRPELSEVVRIAVTDEGHGIPDNLLPKIFDPYFTTKQKGSGLGLASSYSIVSSHGGLIRVRSDVGVGTTFEVYLPVAVAADQAATDGPSRILRGSGRILLMDDDRHFSKVTAKAIGRLGYQVDIAEDGQTAVELFRRAKASGQSYDAVILDLTIPGGMGGETTLRELRKLDPEVRAIVSSGYSNEAILANYQAHGFAGVLPKPSGIEELSRILQTVLEGGVKV